MSDQPFPRPAGAPDHPEPEPALAGHPPPGPAGAPVPAVWGGYPAPPTSATPPPAPYGYLPTTPGPLPLEPVPYQQLLRGPRRRWWKPLATLLVALAIAVPLEILALLPVILGALVAGVADPVRWTAREVLDVAHIGPAGFFYLNLSLIALIPVAGISIWLVHGVRPRFLGSVAGGLRWRWLARCLLVVVPVWAVYLGLGLLGSPAGSRPDHWGLLLVMVLFLTPLQAAGEEYLFRGWILQNVGSWFARPLLGLVLGLAVSVSLFAAAHGSPDVWVLADLGTFALTAGLLTWRTGGLEAGIALHAVNNIGVFCTVLLFGGWDQAFVGADTSSTPLATGLSFLAHAVVFTLVLWQARRVGLERRYLPPAPALPVPAPAPLGTGWPALPGSTPSYPTG